MSLLTEISEEKKRFLDDSDIQIVDSALPEDLYNLALSYAEFMPLQHGWRNVNGSVRRFWHKNFVLPGTYKHHYTPEVVDPQMNYENFQKEMNPFSFVAEMIRHKYFNSTPFTRVWINVQDFGNEGDIHRDFNTDYCRTTKSAILYLQKSWDVDWGGDLAIFDEKGEIRKSILVKPNRLVVFNGCCRHSVRPLSRFCTEVRRALVFATEVVK